MIEDSNFIPEMSTIAVIMEFVFDRMFVLARQSLPVRIVAVVSPYTGEVNVGLVQTASMVSVICSQVSQ
jgi:hypothetical protein